MVSGVRSVWLIVGVVAGLFGSVLFSSVRATEAPQVYVRTWLDEEVALAALLGDSAEAQELILVNVWATWCPPCRDELPLLLEGHHARRYRLITINLGDDPDQVARFLHAEALEALPTYFLSVRHAGLLQLQGLPTTLVYGAQAERLNTVYGPLEPDSLDALLLSFRN